MRRMARAGAVVVLVSALVGGGTTAATAHTAGTVTARHPLDSTRHVRVDGYSVAVDCVGAGSPTVVLFSGFGDALTVWSNFQTKLSRETRVCSYDRLGEGQSSKPRETQTLWSNARLLHDVLAKLNVHGPLVLVGHSIGGDMAVGYARSYPGETAGVVTFDATPPGYLQFVLRLIPRSATGLLAALREEAVTVISGHNQERLQVARTAWAPPRALGSTPLAVVEHGKNIFAAAGKPFGPRLQAGWAGGQLDLAKLSRRSEVVIAPRSGHYIYLDQPQLALDVTRAVISESR